MAFVVFKPIEASLREETPAALNWVGDVAEGALCVLASQTLAALLVLTC